MGEWDFEDEGSGGFDRGGSSRPGKKGPVTGGLHVPMTLVCLLAVSAASFGMAWLMKDQVRSFGTMGLTFAVPFAALMFSALMVESATGKMTPACSRNAQLLFAAGTVVAAFIVGGLAEVLHTPVKIVRVEPEYNYVIVEDKSASMVFQDIEDACKAAVHSLIDGMEDENMVGFVTFDIKVTNEVAVRQLDADQRKRISKAIDLEIPITETLSGYTGPGTNFTDGMNAAIRTRGALRG